MPLALNIIIESVAASGSVTAFGSVAGAFQGEKQERCSVQERYKSDGAINAALGVTGSGTLHWQWQE